MTRPELYYSQCWEDPRSGRAALRLGPTDDLLMVTSAGCNVLALSLDGPRSVTAVDVNPAQNHLLELKIAAIRGFDHEELLAFLGLRPSRERRALYGRIRNTLSAPARAFWDGWPPAIERGVIHAGRFERYLALFRRVVLPLTQSRRRIETILRLDDRDAQRSFYEREWDTWRWRALFRVFFGRAIQSRLGRHPEAFRHVRLGDLGGHYLGRARHALVELPVRGNHYVEYILTGGYGDPEHAPEYTLERHHVRLRASVERVRIVTASVEEVLERSEPGRFSAFYLSDIFEWMPEARYERVLHEIVRVGRGAARLCHYENLIVREKPRSLDGALVADPELGERLYRLDRSFLYRRFVVAHLAGTS